MNYSFQLSNISRADRKAPYLLLAPLERRRGCVSLIPAGDRLSSRGQRPRKTRPQQGPTLKGSNPGSVTPVLRAERGDAGQRLENGQKCALCPTFCLPVGRIVIYPIDNPLLHNGKMRM